MSNPSEQHWFKLIEDYKNSGLSQRQYCIDNQLPLGKFKHYLTRQKEINNSQQVKTNISLDNPFEPIAITSSPAVEIQQLELTINLPNKISCHIKLPSSLMGSVLKEAMTLC
jgi:hypothetical protein